MSDQSEDEEKGGQESGESSAPERAVKTSPARPSVQVAEKPAPAPKRESRRGSSGIAWLALLLIVGLCAAAAWSVREAQRREGALDGRLAALESTENNQRSALVELDQRLRGELSTGMAELESRASAQAGQLQRLEASLLVQREEITRFGATDRKDWLLAEAEYLLRLANQRLIMAGDVVAAAALLGSADAILLELDDVSLHSARAAVAADLAALRAVPAIDVEGLYLRVAALAEQVQGLEIFRLPQRGAKLEVTVAEDWQGRLHQGYEQALHKLSDYIVVRRRDVPYEALMDPQWEGLVRQNMRMLLEQAQVALLSGNQLLFRESLRRASHWAEQFFEVDEAGSKALVGDIAELAQQNIDVEIPDVARSLLALDEAMVRRLQIEGAQ